MNATIMGLIGGLSVRPLQGAQNIPNNHPDAFKKVMNESVRKKPNYERYEGESVRKDKKLDAGKSVDQEHVKVKNPQQGVRQQESETKDTLEKLPIEDQVLVQMMPYLLDLMTLLGMNQEELINTFEQLEFMPEELLIQENFSLFLEKLLEGPDKLLTLDQKTMKDIQVVWKGLEALAQSEEGKHLIGLFVEKNQYIQQVEVYASGEVVHEKMLGDTILQQGDIQQELEQNLQQQTTQSGQLIATKTPLQVSGFGNTLIDWQHHQEIKSLGELTQNMTSRTMTDQIIKKIEISKLMSQHEIQMELTPKELGKMSMKVVTENGIVTAQLKVESDRTKELVIQGLSQLKEGLEKQGLTIGSFQVDVESHDSAQQMNKQKQKSAKRIQEIMNNQFEQIYKEDTQEGVVAQRSDAETQIDYMA